MNNILIALSAFLGSFSGAIIACRIGMRKYEKAHHVLYKPSGISAPAESEAEDAGC